MYIRAMGMNAMGMLFGTLVNDCGNAFLQYLLLTKDGGGSMIFDLLYPISFEVLVDYKYKSEETPVKVMSGYLFLCVNGFE